MQGEQIWGIARTILGLNSQAPAWLKLDDSITQCTAVTRTDSNRQVA